MKQLLRRAVLLILVLCLLTCAAGGAFAVFSDVSAGDYFAEAVDWAVQRGITTGVTATEFQPHRACSRAEAVTFLWRYDRTPHYGRQTLFTDLKAGGYYEKAVCWAVEEGIVKGVNKTSFAPDASCSRAQIVTFLWRYAGSPKVTGTTRFEDVSPDRYYYQAVLWAAKNGVTRGVSATAFSPNRICTRAQIVTMLLRMDKILPEKRLVVIDPGHQRRGNYDKEPIGPGATQTKAKVSSGTYGPTSKLNEYELNLTVSLQLREALERRGYWVMMTRETHDVDISNKERAEFANNVGADAAIRIHANGSDNTAKHGAMTINMTKTSPYNPGLYTKSRALSQSLVNHLCQATGAKNNGVWDTDTMTGINWSLVPVTIVEMGYMSNPTEDRNMATASYQAKIVKGICDGVDEYFAGAGG